MKISKIFHSLYFMVMFLPVFIIPIFAININQKSVEPISIEVRENKEVNFNQLYNFALGTSTYIIGSSNNGLITLNVNNTSGSTQNIGFSSFIDIIQNHVYFMHYLPINSLSGFGTNNKIYFSSPGNNNPTLNENLNEYRFLSNETASRRFQIEFVNGTNTTLQFYLTMFDLTQIYGSGNEPSNEIFLSDFPNNYYDYTTSTQMVVNMFVGSYDNTDIGSQFLYSIYKPVHDYFNFGQYFGLNGVFDWFQVNFFNGTAPLPFFIFWNLLVYWLIISLLWLIFDVLIYVPMYIHRWLDKGALE